MQGEKNSSKLFFSMEFILNNLQTRNTKSRSAIHYSIFDVMPNLREIIISVALLDYDRLEVY